MYAIINCHPLLIFRSRRGVTFLMSDVTQILERVEKGDGKAADELLPLLYEELRRLAAHKMAQEQPGHTLQPTALVHEGGLGWLAGTRVALKIIKLG